MSDHVPDLLDKTPLLRRVALASVFAVLVAGITYFICDSLAKPDEMAGGWDGGTRSRAYHFVYYFTGLGLAVGWTVAMAILNVLAKRKDMQRDVPKAKVR